MKKKYLVILLLLPLIMLSGCTAVSNFFTGGNQTIFSGKVIDSVTGYGISNAEVDFGSTKTTTDSTGKFSMPVSSQPETLSIYKIEQPVEYISVAAGNITINADDSRNKNIFLNPNDTSITSLYPTYNLSGRIYLSGGKTEIPDGSSVDFYIYNSNRGLSRITTTYSSSSSGGYSINSPTFGTDCLIAIYVYDPQSGNLSFSYYEKGINFSDDVTHDFTKPSAGYTDVSVTNGNDYDQYMCFLDTPYGYVPTDTKQGDSTTGTEPDYVYSGSSNTVSIYNPDNYNFFWRVTRPDLTWARNYPGNISGYLYSTDSMPFSGSISLPSAPSFSSIVYDSPLVTTLVYDSAKRILSVKTPDKGAGDYFLGLSGNSDGKREVEIMIHGDSITIPADLANYLHGKSYDIEIIPANTKMSLDKISVFSQQAANNIPPYYKDMKLEMAIYADNTNSGFTF